MAETVIAICLSILVGALVAAISFWAGVRYCAGRMLPGIMARMTSKELDDLAIEVEAERVDLGLASYEDDEEAA